MPRYYRRSYPRRTYPISAARRQKYSSETSAFSNVLTTSAVDQENFRFVIISPISSAGMRKVKNFTLSISKASSSSCVLYWALVYVPEGTLPNPLTISTNSISLPDPGDPDTPYSETSVSSLYEPNQNVIMQGLIPDSSTNQNIFRSRLARNLNSGDGIFLVARCHYIVNADGTDPTFPQRTNLSFSLNYAIAY